MLIVFGSWCERFGRRGSADHQSVTSFASRSSLFYQAMLPSLSSNCSTTGWILRTSKGELQVAIKFRFALTGNWKTCLYCLVLNWASLLCSVISSVCLRLVSGLSLVNLLASCTFYYIQFILLLCLSWSISQDTWRIRKKGSAIFKKRLKQNYIHNHTLSMCLKFYFWVIPVRKLNKKVLVLFCNLMFTRINIIYLLNNNTYRKSLYLLGRLFSS